MTDTKTTDETSGSVDPSSIAAGLISEAVELDAKAERAKPYGRRDEYFHYRGQAKAKREEAKTIDLSSARMMQRLYGDNKK
ncbi:hypothetical protein [Asaia sp. SF2.1]|uniref:hypothetical protein n=1 Tax=Asaia sp. SF2.1 TaxID=406101 RepID=UPI0003D3984A|nr:hypothetical protein [Asaia sp. SF2.1]ETC99538.1 hypothetical protein P792_03650 [Asaia sp. SF2.1]